MSLIEQLYRMSESSSYRPPVPASGGTRRLVPEHVEKLSPYQPGRPAEALKKELGIDKFINLASNENPLGPPKSACEAMKRAAGEINRYPESGAFLLREAIAGAHNVKVENVVVGAGSESIMANIIRAFLHGDDEVLTTEGTFIGLYVLASSHGAKLVKVPLKDYAFDLEAIIAGINERTKLIYLCNPNNPTGTIFTREQFERFIERVPEHVLVILDEAYFEFAMGMTEYPDSLTYRYDNVLTLRSFSKAYAMAGIRLGYGLGHEYLMGFVNKVKLPFEPNCLAQAGGVAALADHEYLRQVIRNNDEGKSYLYTEFEKLGLNFVRTNANFIMLPMDSIDEVARIHQGLLRQGVAIRPLTAFGLPDCLRVTVGLPEENRAFIEALKNIL